jgi:diguanylate cyclase (GGDEF)-like protein
VSPGGTDADTRSVPVGQELRQHLAHQLETRAAAIVRDAIALIPYVGFQQKDDLASRLSGLIVQMLVVAVREGDLDARSTLVADLRELAREKSFEVHQVFEVVYLFERAALDELAQDDSFGAASAPWSTIAQMIRRASFELLAAFATRLNLEAGDEALVDPLTTLHTRPVLLAALDKEIRRTERFRHPFALIVFDVNRLAEINARHGYGIGDRVIERVGFVVRNYFREQDWVCRCASDRFAVLLPETSRAHAEQLAERLRGTVQERLALRDYKSEDEVVVTLSAAVVFAEVVDASVRAEQMLRQAEQALHHARQTGRTVVERVETGAPVKATP